MNYDLKIIKKKFGENMMKLSRELFPTLLEEKGLLSGIFLDNFNPSKMLYDDIKKEHLKKEFKMFIYGFLNKYEVIENSKKTPKELFEEIGYDFYECESEEDIKKFKKYYARGEELCTFNDKRLDKCYVFFVVKKNVDEIKREKFKNPIREDEYGTSVMSIQFTRDETHTLSIKNRYNHALLEGNPDATYRNNLENIAPGLTKSFENIYGLKQFNPSVNFEMKNYVRGKDGKFYKYNYEINNVYYCTDNVIIDNFEVKKLPKERYIVMDYFILDMKDKKITLYDESINDSFVSSIKNIKKIDVLKNGLTKTIVIIGEEGNMIIKLDLNDRIIEVDNETLKNVSGDYLSMTKYIDKLYLNNVIEVGNNFFSKNKSLSKISMDNVKVIGNNFLESNNNIEEVSFLNVEKIGNGFMFQNNNPKLKKIYIPKVEIVGNSFMFRNNSVMEVFMPSVKSIGNNFFDSNQIVRTLEIPLVEKIGDNFLENNGLINELYLPSTINIGSNFLKQNQMLEKLIIPNVIELKSGTLQHNNNLKELYAPRVVKIGNNVLELNNSLTEFESLYLEEVGDNFLKYNRWLEKFIAPNLRKIGLYILSSNNVLIDVDISSLIDEYKDNLSKYMKEMLKQETPYTLKLKY